MGLEGHAGADSRWQVTLYDREDRDLLRLPGAEPHVAGGRFVTASLTSRYASFRELWRRTMQGREEGRDAGAAARASARDEAMQKERLATFVCDDTHKDVATIRQVYNALIEAKMKCGEPTDDLSFPRFHHLIATKADNLKNR